MPVLPLSKNIGPGNVPNPNTESWVDGVAYDHDIAYGNAKSASDVRAADSDFLLRISQQFDSNPLHAIQQLFGGIGIGAKYAFESVAGVQYPNFMDSNYESYQLETPPTSSTTPQGEKRAKWDSKGPLGKRAKIQDSKISSSTKDDAGANGAVGEKNHLDVLSNPCNRITGFSPFRTCKTYDLELVTFNPNFTVKNEDNPIGLWVAPMYSFAVELLGWYLNKGEINYINYINGATWKVSRAAGSISLGILNSPFVTQTASSNQTSANTNVNVALYSGKGLEDHFIMYNGLGTTNYSSTSGDYPLSAWTSGLYDTSKLNNYDFTGTTPTLPATQVIRSYNQLVAFPTQVTQTASTNKLSNCLAPPCYKEKMTKIIESTAGGVLCEWEYNPNCCLTLQNTPAGQWNGKLNIGADAQPVASVSPTSTAGPANTSMSAEASNESSITYTSAINYDNHYNLGGHGKKPRMMGATAMLPREYIAFLPPTTVSGAAVQPIKIAIQVKTEIELMPHMDLSYSTNACVYPYSSDTVSWPTATNGNVGRFNATALAGSTDNWAGLGGMQVVNT